MEDSLTPSLQNRPAGSDHRKHEPAVEEEEESGWTAYFEDFSDQQRQQHSPCSSLGTSMVSDAASCAAWRLSNHNLPKAPKKLRFKNTRTKEISQDDSLEDTASSPLNSPKVSDAKPMDMNQRKGEDHHMNSSLGKGYIPDRYSDRETIFNSNNNDCTDDHLKKRGLCLVPMSMLVNYFG